MANSGLLFLSPHFDDVVLSCSSFLQANPNSVVATVCSGVPKANVPAGQWDEVSGFTSAREAVIIRQNEDRMALREFHARQRQLGFLDSMYLGSGHMHEQTERFSGMNTGHDQLWAAVEEIGTLLDELTPTHCFFPLGIFSGDHLLTRRAALLALSMRPWCAACVYLDIPHTLERPSLVKAQLDWLQAIPANDVKRSTDMSAKHRAVGCYRSQITPLRLAFSSNWAKIFESPVEEIFSMTPVMVEACAVKLEEVSRRRRSTHAL